jgi:hypothetical protein
MSVLSYIKEEIGKRPVMFLVLVVFFLYLQYLPESYNKDKINRLFEPITSEYEIEIVYEIGDDFFSPIENPPIPAGPARYSKVEPIKHRVLRRYPVLLKKAFEKYPVHVIKSHLNAIYFSGEINADGFKYSGTYDPFRKIVYMVDDGSKDDEKAMRTFHHEFSSLLLKSHSFFINPWTDNNLENFHYLGEIYDSWKTMQKEVDISDESAEDYQKGFMNVYGQTNFGNDFNEYSAMIFTYPEKFKKIMNQYPRVRAKFKVWLEFYRKVDPIFTEAYLLGED